MPAHPLLPPGLELDEVLAEGPGRLVARVSLADSGEALHLRAEGPGGQEIGSELGVLATVRHPGIAGLLDHGVLPGGGRFVLRAWVEGQDLATWAAHRTAEDVGRRIAEAALALAELHRLGFVHGDVKAENLVVQPDGGVVLVDFGLSRRQGQTVEERGASGTLFALAPELLGGLGPTPATDLFALGAMLARALVPGRVTAREFYASFPTTSFLDAARIGPEELPAWARDLVVSLTARSPDRRPASAAEVARTLASRLELELPRDSVSSRPRWPVSFGRDAWVAEWLRGAASSPLEWLRVPAGEDPRALFEHLRVQSALTGRPAEGVDLAEVTGREPTGVELDRWARRRIREAEGRPILVLASTLDASTERSLEVLRLAAEVAAERSNPPHRTRLAVLSAHPPTPALEAAGFGTMDAPRVDRVTANLFFERCLAQEDPERRRAFAERFVDACSGSATAADACLARCVEEGLLQESSEGYRLRPGELADLPAPLAAFGGDSRLAAEEAALLDALRILGPRAEASDVLRLVGAEPSTLAAQLAAGRVRFLSTEGGARRPVVSGMVPFPASGPTGLRALHARLAAAAPDGDDPDPETRAHALGHRLAAEAGEHGGTEAELAAALRELRDRGRPETALSILEVLLRSLRACGEQTDASVPELVVERARALAAIGRTRLAQQELERLLPELAPGSPVAARAELGLGQVASLTHRTSEALAHFAHALTHPATRIEASLGRLRVLHAEGRDREVLDETAALDLDGLERSGALAPRLRAYLESVCAMSAHRLGETETARETTCRLVEGCRASGDTALEAALHINLSLMERASGSLERAREELHLAMALYDRAGLVSGLAQAQAMLGGLLRELGELLEAEPLLTAAAETRARMGDRDGATTARGILGLLLYERGHLRPAIETLRASADAMEGAQRLRFAPFLEAVLEEARARIGAPPPETEEADEEGAVGDPRILLARARTAWLRGQPEAASALAARTEEFALSLKLDRLARTARALRARAAGKAEGEESWTEADGVARLDARVHALLTASAFDESKAAVLAEDLERRGLDDRAARLFLALVARTSAPERAEVWGERADAALSRCTAGLSQAEGEALRHALLAEPDPAPGDLLQRVDQGGGSVLPDQVQQLFSIHRRLLDAQELPEILGTIVEHACQVTGAERGFLALEEQGTLRFDTALESCRGEIARPELEVSASILHEALERGETLRVSNAVDDPLLGSRTSVVSLELRSVLCVPFVVDRGLRGAIYLDHRLRRGAFGETAATLCEILADQAALAVHHWKQLDEIRRLNQRLSSEVQRKDADLEDARLALRHAGGPRPRTLLVGSSAAMSATRARIERAAATDLPVLITGESGTGKELAARSLHELSARAERPFITENCAALPANLIESELFGFKRGAFTGADRDHVGIIEQASGGTLFLDEIGELPLELQSKLLRVLETHTLRRLGESETREVDFRLVSATNRDLEEEVREGRFRSDLFFRLNVFPVSMPTLEERPEDIPELAEYFLREASGSDEARSIAPAVLTALARRAWPGNVRELRNELARLAVLSDGALDDPGLIRPAPRPARDGEAPAAVLPLAEVERRAILHALEVTGGDRRRAAELLGISRAKIYQRLKEWREQEGSGDDEAS